MLRCAVQKQLDHGSDHWPTLLTLDFQGNTDPQRPRRLWKHLNHEKYHQSLSQWALQPVPLLITLQDLDLEASNIHNAVLTAIDTAVPWRTPSTYAAPYWTPACSIAVRNARLARRTATLQNGAAKAYTAAQKEKRTVLRKAQTQHFRTQIHEASLRVEGIWNLAKWAKDKSTEPTPLPQFPSIFHPITGVLAHSFTEQTEALQAQFFPPPTVADLTDIPGTVYPPPICGTDEITEAEVEAIIQGLKPLKAAGLNGINHLALQTALPHIKKRTTLLF